MTCRWSRPTRPIPPDARKVAPQGKDKPRKPDAGVSRRNVLVVLTSGVSIVKLLRTHHIAVICSDYGRSRRFYVETLGLEVVGEVYRRERDSYKLDLRLPDGTQIELFHSPTRRSDRATPRPAA